MIPWAAIAQAVQLGLQATKTYMDYKKSKKSGGQSQSYDDGSDDAFGGRVLQAYAQKDGPAPEGGGEDSWMQRIPEIAKVMTSFRGNANPSSYAPPLPDIAPVAPGAGISANPMNISYAPRAAFEGRIAGPVYPAGEPEYLRLRDVLSRYRLR
jgi:hypothetical protein